MRVILLLGAGFCVPAGLPIGAALFDSAPAPHSRKATCAVERTLSAWHRWRAENPESPAECFISDVFQSTSTENLTLWPSLIRFLGYRLAEPFATFYRYENRTSRSRDNLFEARLCAAHDAWWEAVLTNVGPDDQLSVITTNWDIWIERALRPRPMPRSRRPGFHYGWGAEKLEATTAYPRSPWRKEPYIHGSVPLLKLHGSLSWSVEGDRLLKYGDLRPAFRGDVAIVPPLRYKVPPSWAGDLWQMAKDALARATHVVVVGYSFPAYDDRLERLFREALSQSNPDVHVFDPNADEICARLDQLIGVSLSFPHAGLPEGIPAVQAILSGAS